MGRGFLVGLLPLIAATPAGAQAMDHAMHDMPGMSMSAPAASPPGQVMPGMAMPAQQPLTREPPPTDHAADRYYDPQAMEAGRELLRTEQGDQRFYMVLLNLLEYQVHQGRDGYRWDGEGWYGGDIHRFWFRSEGEGSLDKLGHAEAQALYSVAVGPYTDLQAGVRHDFRPNPTRTYGTVGFETLAPFFFEAEGALFLSNKGDLFGRLEGYFDQHITQRLILQPRVELNLAAQNVHETGTGRGLSTVELGLRLRYEIRREFAPYIGVSWDRKVGRTADFAREEGERAGVVSFVTGIRFWF